MNAENQNIACWLADKLENSLANELARIARLPDVRKVAVMPDVHTGALVPNGMAVATSHLIYPALIGADIGCGLSAIRCGPGIPAATGERLESVLTSIRERVPTIRHRNRLAVPELPEACRAADLSNPRLAGEAERGGRLQLGTVGRGNHFIELERDDLDALWIVVHSGSRSMGQVIFDYHRHRAASTDLRGIACFDGDAPEGKAFLQDMNWAVRYARENRMLILNAVADLAESHWGSKVDEGSYIDCPHNFGRRETHFGESLFVHRKSANSAGNGEIGIVPGSMATGSRIVEGLGNEDALCSSSHGTGRKLSRKAAFETISAKEMASGMRGIAFDRDNSDGLRDEAPQAYRDLREVMRAQRDLVKTRLCLRPILNDKRV